MSENDENESNDKESPQIKERERQFLEERMSTITPKTETVAPANVEEKSEFDESASSLKEDFRQDLIKQYRESQKEKIKKDDE